VRIVDNDKPIDAFEDLFEPFDLQEGPPAQPGTTPGSGGPPTGGGPPGQGNLCPSCGSLNPPFNQHCEACGARISQAPLPVAPQPLLRTTAGARALMVLAGVILTVAVLAGAVNLFRGGGETTTSTTEAVTTTEAALDIVELEPIRVDCDSELAAFPCSALTESDPERYWNAEGEEMIGTRIQFLFAPPVRITEIYVYNLEDEAKFHRNARIRGLEVVVDDLPTADIVELMDSNEPQKIQPRSLRTSRLTLTITSAYPGETWEDQPPYKELAVQEIVFYGRVSPDVEG
jgi:hypothetical protein